MRKLVAGFASSLDGYIEGSDESYDWIIIDKEIDFPAYMKRFDTYLFGRKSYEKVLPLGSLPAPLMINYVVSNTLTEVNEKYRLIKGDVKTQVNILKQEAGKDIAVFGGASLVASLLDLKLIDEISISIIPVLLGKGKAMVDILKDRVWLKLTDTKSFSNGTVQVTYQVLYEKPE